MKDLDKFKKSLPAGREWAGHTPRKKSGTDDMWIIPGEQGAITGTTLRGQRGYHLHSCGRWSRYAGGVSENSIDV